MKLKFVAFSLAILAAGAVASANAFDQIYVFGDSLSDNGNAALALGNNPLAPLPPNYNGSSYTDGPNTTPATTGPFGLWIDQFAAKIGVADPQPFLAGGTNYAVASAQTGTSSIQDMGNQLTAYLTARSADPNALYVVFGGSNDLLDASSSDDPASVATTALGNLTAGIEALASAGAKNILWFNIPSLQNTPAASAGGAASKTFLQTASQDFDAGWSAQLAAFQSGGLNIHGVDLYTLMNDIVANPSNYNLTNVTVPAQGLTGVNPNEYLFWDAEHPTTAGAALIADAAAAAVPEPDLFVPFALAAMGFAMRRHRSAR